MCDESARASSDARVAVERQKEIRNSLGYHNLSYLVVYTFRDIPRALYERHSIRH
jgi:hypothetical protein